MASDSDIAAILIQNATILSMDNEVGDFEHGDILIEGRTITRIGPNIAAPPGAQIIDASNRIAIPGFVDCHRHAWEGALRLMHPDSKDISEYFGATLGGFRPFFRPEDVYAGTLATAAACIDSGITTVIDNMHCHISASHGSAAVDAWSDSGVGAIVAIEQAPWGASLSPSVEEIKANITYLREHISTKRNSSFLEAAIFGQFFDEEFTAARELGVRIVSEVVADFIDNQITRAWEKGQLDSTVTFNHCTSIPISDFEIIREANVRVNISPRSDAQWSLAGGICAFQRAIDNGVNPGISIDNEIAYGGDMFSEMKVLFSLQRALASQKHSTREGGVSSPITVRQILRAATIDGARNCGWEDRVGSLTPGKEANIVLIRSDDLNIYPCHSAAGAVVLAADRSNIETVIISGRIQKQDGKVIGVDLAALKERLDESISYLFRMARFKKAKTSEYFPGV